MRHAQEDPVVRTGRREAAISLALFAIAVTYTVTFCSWYGYDRNLDELRFILGFPDWVFLGILLPWSLCALAGAWMGGYYVTDNPLEDAAPPPDGTDDSEEPDRD
jgi:hypothetical protein